MAYNICLIDDQIPLGEDSFFIDDKKRLNSSNIELLIKGNDKDGNLIEWSEVQLKTLLTKLLDDNSNWTVSAFKHPNIYLQAVEDENYLPDFVIFDWDYGTTSEESELLLMDILEKSFAVITIYTASDKEVSVREIIKEDFKEFNNRISLIIKSENDSTDKLIEYAQIQFNENFSFKFANELRKFNNSSLENILVEFGKLTIKDIIWLFGEKNENGKLKFEAKELSEMIVEKLKNILVSKKFGSVLEELPQDYKLKSDLNLAKEMWSYRLYYRPQDDIVRKGDIIKKIKSDNDNLYLVLASDCHLRQFWKKNFGTLTLVPLFKIQKQNAILLKKLKFNKNSAKLDERPSSLTNFPRKIEGVTIVPFIPSNYKYYDYFLFPKDIHCYDISFPSGTGNSENTSLLYNHLKEFTGLDRVTISEPFITPLIEHILYNISGFGVPDYPKNLQDDILNNFQGIFK